MSRRSRATEFLKLPETANQIMGRMINSHNLVNSPAQLIKKATNPQGAQSGG